MKKKSIQNGRELEFAVFCIENVADRLGVNPVCIYDAFTKKSDILRLFRGNGGLKTATTPVFI